MVGIRQATDEDAETLSDVLCASIRELCSADHKNDSELIARWTANKASAHMARWIANPRLTLAIRSCGPQTRDWRWIIGAVLILAKWPYTMLGMMPTNNRLKAIANDAAGPIARATIETWGRLHAIRTALGMAAMMAYLWALS